MTDAQRMDWMEKHGTLIQWAVGYRGSAGCWTARIGIEVVEFPSLRAAVDAAHDAGAR